MNNITSGKGFKVLITVICLLLVLALVTAGNRTVGGIFTAYVLTPLRKTAAGLMGQAEETIVPPRSAEELAEENSRLQEENRRLNELLVDYYDLKKENEELYQFYDIKKENKELSVLPAQVITRDPNEFFYGFVLDKGSQDGVELNDPVMTVNGLVGYVSEVSLRSAKVTPLLSPAASVSAVAKRSGDDGIMTGDAALAEKNLTTMKNLSAEHQLQIGDIVTTSGYGGIYPQNIRIGTVSNITLDSYTGLPMAEIRPFEDARELTSAAVIINFSGKGELAAYHNASENSENNAAGSASFVAGQSAFLCCLYEIEHHERSALTKRDPSNH